MGAYYIDDGGGAGDIDLLVVFEWEVRGVRDECVLC